VTRPAEGPEIREVSLEVLRTARVALLGPDPQGPPEEAWYLLHGYRQLARRLLTRCETLVTDGRLVAAPEGLSRFYLSAPDRAHGAQDPIGASWMTREDREAEIRDYVRYLDRTALALEAGGRPERTVLGFSQGAHTAARWAVLGRARPSRLVLWGSALPGDLPDGAAERMSSMELIVVRGKADGLRRKEDEIREEAWLGSEGIPYRILEHPGGHEITSEVLARIVAGD